MSADGAATPGRAYASGHLVALDGVRGLAILLVLFVHFVADWPAQTGAYRVAAKLSTYGIWGVDLFFVLSGFLITGILFDSKAKPRYFRDFYVRRTLRIFPLYYAVLALSFLVLPALGFAYPAGMQQSAVHQGWLWLYVSNVYLALHRSWALPYFGHFWSLAVEEQFYLLWPIVVLSYERIALMRICAGAAGMALLCRIVLSAGGAGYVAQVVLTPCRLDALCVGGFLALAMRSFEFARVASVARRSVVPLVGLVFATSAWNATLGSLPDVVLPLRGTLVALTFGALLVLAVAADRASLLSRVFRSRVMCFLGTRSYGLYVFHGIVAYAIWDHPALVDALARRLGFGAAVVCAALGGALVSLVVSEVSYEVWEKPFLRLKNRFAPHGRDEHVVPPLVGARPAQ